MTPCIHTYKREKSLLRYLKASEAALLWKSAEYTRHIGGNTFRYRLSRTVYAFCRGANYPYGRTPNLQPKCNGIGELI